MLLTTQILIITHSDYIIDTSIFSYNYPNNYNDHYYIVTVTLLHP